MRVAPLRHTLWFRRSEDDHPHSTSVVLRQVSYERHVSQTNPVEQSQDIADQRGLAVRIAVIIEQIAQAAEQITQQVSASRSA